MWRHASRPREGWRDTVVRQGLIFPTTPVPGQSGDEVLYWNETAWYEFTMDEVETLEAATDELYGMCLEAGKVMADRFTDDELMLPTGSMELVRESLARSDPSAYARFDLAFDGGTPKMLEINGDTPTGLVETAVIQWNWLEDLLPESDQWNSVHDRLVMWWKEQAARGAFPGDAVHFLHTAAESTGEEEMTTVYMRDTAAMAGLHTYGHVIEDVGWDAAEDGQRFVDAEDLPIRSAFKLYPWEDLLAEGFGVHLLQRHEREPVRWVEPAWKLMLSTKAILAVLWELYPDHPNLLPAYLGHSGDLEEWVAKPLQGREGDNIRVHTRDSDEVRPGAYDGQTMVYQAWNPVPSFDGNRAVIGSWVVGGVAAGCIVRESDGPITDYFSRVVPHAIGDGLMPEADQVQQWLRE